MPRRKHPCPECQTPCLGVRCQKCSPAFSERYKPKKYPTDRRARALKRERVTATVEKSDSWWMKPEAKQRAGFTDLALDNILPSEDAKLKAYHQQTVEP